MKTRLPSIKILRKITRYSLLPLTLCLGSCDATSPPQEKNPAMNHTLKITVGASSFTARLADHDAANAFKSLLPLTIIMNELHGNEKYSRLQKNLPTAPVNTDTIHTGDLMLWGSDTLVLFYRTFSASYSYTKLGHIDDTKGLAKALGNGNVKITFELK